MLSPQERENKKITFAKKTSESTAKYTELYAEFSQNGYSKRLAEDYADYFVLNQKKPCAGDILQAARLYDKIHDFKNTAYYLEKIEEIKKLNSEERFLYCIESLRNRSKAGHWRDAEDFRTENIQFMQEYSVKADMDQQADLYIALALSDCCARHYDSAVRLLTGFGYKPKGRNDVKLFEMLITSIYICSKTDDQICIDYSIEIAQTALGLFNEFEFPWSKAYFEQCISDAAEGIV